MPGEVYSLANNQWNATAMPSIYIKNLEREAISVSKCFSFNLLRWLRAREDKGVSGKRATPPYKPYSHPNRS